MTKIDEQIDIYNGNAPRIKLNRKIFFDESNNIRKGKIGIDKDNNEDLENLCFTLGGIATKKEIDFQDLLNYIGAKQTPNDAKYNFFTLGHKKFTEAIAQSRLRKLFEYLYKENIIIHFAVEHYMHFALVDILDSLIEEADINQREALSLYKELQSDMTEVLYDDYDSLHKILVNYEFPNVPKEQANNFIRDILNLYSANLDHYDMNSPDNFTKELLRQIIKAKKEQTNLIFLEDNEPLVISDLPVQNYLMRMYNFEDEKIFDNESLIEAEIRGMDEQYEQKLNAKFCDSKDYREIQISDAIAGFVGRLYNFLSKTNEENIKGFVESLDSESENYKTMKTFFELMDKSNDETEICFMLTIPLFIEKRFNLLYNAVTSKIYNKK